MVVVRGGLLVAHVDLAVVDPGPLAHALLLLLGEAVHALLALHLDDASNRAAILVFGNCKHACG
eukprot:13114622-Alexandrium_andersonii.AAC.1